ncbi:sensor histidine kinase [Modestobacter altitudinis]|uniref:sensor histidine kinase n=1 Tax=Modestobacter altitudinis TaxID=2213158 RepID=UPI00110D22E6|nr:histidine kinase [Modestobacter altitudinis]
MTISLPAPRRGLSRLAGEAISAATRPADPRWAEPWGRVRWAPVAVRVVLGLYGTIVSIALAGALFNGRNGLAGGLAFLCLLPLVAALVVAVARPLHGWLAVTGWLLLLKVVLPAPAGSIPVFEMWSWFYWLPVLLLAAWAARGRERLGVVLVTYLAFLPAWAIDMGRIDTAAVVPVLLLTAVPLVVGSALASQQRAEVALHDEQERAAQALSRQGALAERARIAREMHDVVAHHMSMIAVRCETAPYRIEEVPAPVRTEFAEVAAAARQSLAEMQSLLGVLRSDDGAERAPQPGLADVEALLRAARAAGAELMWELHLPEAPPAFGLTAYRIVQQGLANAAQHAPGAQVRVRVAGEDDVLRIEIVNGPGTTMPSGPGGGHGLPGMRERAAVHGGTVEAGALPGGGFRLVAALPLTVGVPA